MRSNLLGTLHLLEAVRSRPAGERPVVVAVGSSETEYSNTRIPNHSRCGMVHAQVRVVE